MAGIAIYIQAPLFTGVYRAMDSIIEKVKRDGFAVVDAVLNESEIESFRTLFRNSDAKHGLRNLLLDIPEVRQLAAATALRGLVEPVLGPQAFPVRGLFFDKPSDANWKVPWHQDLSIPVRERRDVNGFGGWSTKAGITHCDAPASVMEKMLVVRLHLDACTPENGALTVIPGSHASGKLNAEQISGWSRREAQGVYLHAGAALLMRPLLLHASRKATAPTHRRVIHLEYASEPLPGELEWAMA